RDDRLERLIITKHSAAVLFDELAHRDADGRLVDAGLLHVTRDAIEPRATVAGETAPRGPGLATDVDDVRDGRDRLDVVDDRRHAEGALDRRKGRLEARLAALALERLQQRCLFAADVRARARVDVHVDLVAHAEGAVAEV